MTTMISEIYDALKDAEGVSDEKARKAAEAVAQFDTRFADLKTDISELRAELKGDISELRAELKGDISELRAELKGDISELRAELKGDIRDLRAEMDTRFAEVKSEIKELRAEFTGKFLLLQWQLYVLIGGVLSLILKAFF